MPTYEVEIPGSGKYSVESPTDLTDQQAYFAVMQQIDREKKPEAPAPVAPATPQKRAEDVGFFEGIGAAGRRGIESLGDVASGLGLAGTALTGTEEETRRKMQAIRAEQMKPQETPGTTFADLERIYKEKGLMSALGEVPKYASEQILQSAPQMAAPLAAGAAASPFLTPVGGALVGMGVYGIQQFGNFLVRQAVEKQDPKELEVAKAALTAAGTAPIGYFADRFTVGLGSLGKTAGKEVMEELAKRSGMDLAAGVTKQVGKGAVEGIIAEAPTEVLEQAAERYQAGLSLSDPDAMNEYKEAFFGAAAAGGGMKGVSTGLDVRSGIREARAPKTEEIPPTLLPEAPEAPGIEQPEIPGGEGPSIRALEIENPPIGAPIETPEAPTVEAPQPPVETPPVTTPEAPPVEAPPVAPPITEATPPVETPSVQAPEAPQIQEILHPFEIAMKSGDANELAKMDEALKPSGIHLNFNGEGRINLNESYVKWDKMKTLRTGQKLLNHIRDFVPLDTREILDRITPYVKDIPVYLNKSDPYSDNGKLRGTHAFHQPGGKDREASRIEFLTKSPIGNTFETIAHEFVHGATVRNYYQGHHYNQYKGAKGERVFAKPAQELNELASYLIDNHFDAIPFLRNYKQQYINKSGRFKSLESEKLYKESVAKELLTWGTTNRETQEILKSIKLPSGKSVWSKFVETMRNLLQIPATETNALSRILEVQDKLIGGKPIKPLLKTRAGRERNVAAEAARIERTPEFRKWFGNSKVVDENGNPLVVYHGTNLEDEYSDEGGAFKQFAGRPNWFATEPYTAEGYGRGEGATIYPAFLSIKNPLRLGFDMNDSASSALQIAKDLGINPEYIAHLNPKKAYEIVRSEEFTNAAERAGYDGIEVNEGGYKTFGSFKPNQIKSIFNERPTEAPEIDATRQEAYAPEESLAPRTAALGGAAPEATWELKQREDGTPLSQFTNNRIYEYVDKFVDLKDIINAINTSVKTGKKKLDETWNAYRRETLYHNRVAFMTNSFLKNDLKPLAEDMVKRNISEEELNNYLLARHAAEYNRQINERNKDAVHLQDRGSGVETRIAEAYMKGASKQEIQKLLDLFAKNEITLNKNEEALLKDLATMTDAKRRNLAEVAKRVDNIVKGTQKIAVAGGLEKQATVDYWNDIYPNYVPLKRNADELDFVEKNYGAGRGFSTKSGFGRAATGSLKTVDNIMANLILQRDMAIVRAEKGRIGRALYAMALQNPNPAFWLPVNPEASVISKANDLGMQIAKTKDKLKAKIAKVDADIAAGRDMDEADLKEIDDIRKKLSKDIDRHKDLSEQAEIAKQNMIKELKKFDPAAELDPAVLENLIREPQGAWYNPATGLVEYKTNAYLRSSPNVLAVPVDGETRYIFFNPGDSRAKRLVNSLKSADVEQMGQITSTVGKFTRYIAQVNTQFNPFFGIVNMLRDVQGAQLNLSSTALAGKQMAVNSHILGSMTTIYRSLRSERYGGQPMGKYAADWKEFEERGGPTGIKDMLAREQDKMSVLAEEISKLKESPTKKGGRKALETVFGLMSDFNDVMENSVRLSAFIEAKKKFKEQGFKDDVAADKAAELAKNLTVNFNRKGAKSQFVNSWFAFFNAAVQGSARLAETLKGPAGKKIISSLIGMGVIQQFMLASAGFSDDDPPEFVRARNLIFPTADGKYISFPMPLGFNALVNTGRIATAAFMDGGKHPAKYLEDFAGSISDSFNPLGSSGLSMQTLAPTIADPMLAIEANKDAFGRPIYREDRANKPTPGYLRSSEGSNAVSRGIAEFLNRISGGTEFQKGAISPTADEIDYLAGQLGGGTYREAKKVIEYAKSKAEGEEVAPYKVPLAGRFMGDTGSEANARSRFYQNVTQLSKYEDEIKGRAKTHQDIQGFLKEHPEARLYDVANSVENEIIQMNKLRKEMVARGASKEQLKRLNDMKIQRMRQFNALVEKASQQ